MDAKARLTQRLANLQRMIEQTQALTSMVAMQTDMLDTVDVTTRQGLADLEQRLRVTLAKPGVMELRAAFEDAHSADTNCLVCLEGAGGTLAISRRCGHAFHFACIHRWTQTGKRCCPACRRDLLA